MSAADAGRRSNPSGETPAVSLPCRYARVLAEHRTADGTLSRVEASYAGVTGTAASSLMF